MSPMNCRRRNPALMLFNMPFYLRLAGAVSVSISANPETITGLRFGNSATMERRPPHTPRTLQNDVRSVHRNKRGAILDHRTEELLP